MVCYSHLLKNFPQLVVIHTVKGFGVVNKAEIDVFLELSRFIDDTKAFNCVHHNKQWKIIKEMGIPPPYLPPEKSVCRSRSNS